MKKAVLILFQGLLALLLFGAVPQQRPDLICGDIQASFYRDGSIDTRIGQIPRDLSAGLQSDPEKYLPLLVRFLQEGARDEYHVVKRMHDWITDNIAYDNDAFFGLGRCHHQPYDLLPEGRTTCGGFARLFQEMCRLAGIEVLYIYGLSRNYQGPDGAPSGHAWNAVRINGRWLIIDTTADNRFSYHKGRFSAKGAYQDDDLFLSPQAKLLENFPDRPEHFLTESSLTEEEFLSRPLLDKNTLDYPEVRFINLAQIVTKLREEKEGGRQIRFYDLLDTGSSSLSVILECPENILITTTLYDDTGKRYDWHHSAAYEKGRVTCSFSAPARGVYKASIRAQYLDRPDTAHTLYQFRVQSRTGTGSLLPAPLRLEVNQRIPFSGFRLTGHNLDQWQKDGCVRLSWSHPPVYSLYSVVKDRQFQDVKGSVIRDYGVSNTTYYYRPAGPGVYQLPLYIRLLADTNNSHQKAAWLQLEVPRQSQAAFPPHLSLIRYARFHEAGLYLLDEQPLEGPPGVYSLRIKIPAGAELSCSLQDENGKTIERHAVYHQAGDTGVFSFSLPPAAGAYKGRISLRNEQGTYNLVAYLSLESAGRPGPYLPLAGQLYTQNEALQHSLPSPAHNLDTARQDGYLEFRMPLKTGMDYWLSFYDQARQHLKGTVTQSYEVGQRVYYIVPPDQGHYHGLLYFRYPGKEEKFQHHAYRFGVEGLSRTFNSTVPPYRMIYYARFQDLGLELLTGSPEDLRKGQAVFTVRAPQGFKLTANMKNDAGQNQKDLVKISRDGQLWTLVFTRPPQGLYTCNIYAAPEEQKNYNGVAWFAVE